MNASTKPPPVYNHPQTQPYNPDLHEAAHTLAESAQKYHPSPSSSSTSPDLREWEGRTESFLNAAPEPTPAAPPPKPAVSENLAINFRHSGWSPLRKKVQAALFELVEIPERRRLAFCTCGADAYVEQEFSAIHNQSIGFRVRSNKCHDRFCVPCSNERSYRIKNSLLQHMYKRPNMSLITLTLKASTDDLTQVLDRITAAFKKLRNSPLWKKACVGGCSIIETKIGTNGESWHLHYHVLAETKYIKKEELSELWLKITGGSYIVDIKRVGSHGGAVGYITKYITKAADPSIVNSPRHLHEAIVGFAGRRLVTTFGSWRGLQLMEDNDYAETQTAYPTVWRTVGSLHDIINASLSGNLDSIKILRALRSPTPRPPPGEAVREL